MDNEKLAILLNVLHVCICIRFLFLFIQCSSGNAKAKITKVLGGYTAKKFRYSLKVISPKKKSVFSVHSLPDATSKFVSIGNVKEVISKFLQSDVVEVGYISPGHGAKGKHNSLLDDDDLSSMYLEYEGKRGVNGVLLWCYGVSAGDSPGTRQSVSTARKRSKSPTKDENPPLSKCGKKLKEIEEIVQKLKEKHAKLYTLEQYNCWAHTIDMGKHESYECPPDLPFFVGKRARATTNPSSASAASSSSPMVTQESMPPSPGKRIRYRGECMDQLTKWHSLMEKGIITQDQYRDFRSTILSDIEKL